jgi:hypothetical protein
MLLTLAVQRISIIALIFLKREWKYWGKGRGKGRGKGQKLGKKGKIRKNQELSGLNAIPQNRSWGQF